MESTSLLYKQFSKPTGYSGKLAGWLMTAKNKARSDWTVDLLEVKPYQHILEVGYGTGRTLEEVGIKLKIGFIAGIDHSILMYQEASKRNKRFIRQQLMQLHLGKISDLNYPSHYFHTIYGSNVHFFWKEPQYEFMQLARLLKSGGKLVMVFQPRSASNEEEIKQAAEKIRQEFTEAGLVNIQLEYKDMDPVTCIAATGYKS
jgi:ubiquinone/menaquinone biosynthesis C-methylase UbiE